MDSLARHFSSAQKSSQRSPEEENASTYSKPKSFRKKILNKVNELKQRSSSNLSKRKAQVSEDTATCSSDGNTTFVTCDTSRSVKKSHSAKKKFCTEQPQYAGDESCNTASFLKRQQKIFDSQAREILQLKRCVSKKNKDIEKCKNFYTEKTGRLVKVMESLTERFNHLRSQLEDVKSTRELLETSVREQGQLNERLMEENRSLQSGIMELIEDMRLGRDRSALKRRGVIRRLSELLDDSSDVPRQREHHYKLRHSPQEDHTIRDVASETSEAFKAGFSGFGVNEEEKKLGTKLEALDAEVELIHVTLEALQANRLVFNTPTPSSPQPTPRSKVKSGKKKSKKETKFLFEDWRRV